MQLRGGAAYSWTNHGNPCVYPNPDSSKYKDSVMKVANAPGEKIYPGELDKALKILASGGDIDYVGASAVELIGPGESAGSYRETEIKNGKWETVMYH